jgi:hypothetical protein
VAGDRKNHARIRTDDIQAPAPALGRSITGDPIFEFAFAPLGVVVVKERARRI